MSELVIQRTPDVIAAEIKAIDTQVKSIVLTASVEIGRRLIEAKEQLPHGQWGKWLEESVSYSHSTANNLMKLYREYGDKITSIGNFDYASLPYTKAVALLAVPAEERDQFVEDHDIENMSARELQEAIRKQREAEERAAAAEKRAADAELLRRTDLEARKTLERELQEKEAAVEALKAQMETAVASEAAEDVTRLQKQLEEKENELLDAQKELKKVQAQLKEKPIEVPATVTVEKVPDEILQELEKLRKIEAQFSTSEAAIKFKVAFESLGSRFSELLAILTEIPEEDRGKYQAAVIGLLGSMSEKIG